MEQMMLYKIFKMKNQIWIGLGVIGLTSIGSGCQHASLIDLTTPTVTVDCDPDTVYFQNDILPLLVSNCAMSGCHDGNSYEEEAEALNSYDAVLSSGYVDAFNWNNSKMFEAVTRGGDDQMPPPPADKLTSDQLALLETWMNQGARNNACEGGACDTLSVTYSNQVVKTINTNCKGCHSGATPSGGIDLSSYDGVAAIAADGSLLGSINFDGGYVGMPYSSSMMSDCKIAEIRIWIENGYPND
jgi:mono/diheme cytochrome c family protein